MTMDFVAILSVIGALASVYRLYLALKDTPDTDQFDIRFKSVRNSKRQVNRDKKHFLSMLNHISAALGPDQQKKKSNKKKKSGKKRK